MILNKILSLWPPFGRSGPIVPPDKPGIEYSATNHKVHFLSSAERMHFNACGHKMHYNSSERRP